MRIAFVGCVEFSKSALQLLIGLQGNDIQVVGVVTKESSKFNSDFVDLSCLCKESDIPYFYATNDNELVVEFLKECTPDIIYCFGWSSLLNQTVLSIAPKGVVGFHPAALPFNRGRHPIIWALALGLTETASTFFLMDSWADSGPIVSQRSISILEDDDAKSLYEKITRVALQQIKGFTFLFKAGTEKLMPQDSVNATYWRKRTAADGLVDWRISATDIHNLVKALSPPYPGAKFQKNGILYSINKTKLEFAGEFQNAEPGKVLQTNNGEILVKCGNQTTLWILNHDMPAIPSIGEYL